MRDGRIDGVFRHVPLHAEVVVAVVVVLILRQRTALLLHLVGGLPCAGDDLADAAHRLGIGAHHGDQSHIVQHVLRADGLRADARIREGDVFGHMAVEVMRDHHHVEMLVDGVACERHGRIRGARQHVREARRADDVGRVATAGAFRMVRVDGTPLERGDGVFHAAALVQGVGVDGDLHVHFVGDAETGVDHGGRRAPILVDLQTGSASANLITQRFRRGTVALAEICDVDRQCLGRLDHPRKMERARRAGGGVGAVRGTGAAAHHGGHAAGERRAHLLRRDEVDVRVQSARGEDESFARDGFGAGADFQSGRDAVHGLRVACFADRADFAVFDADVGFVDAGVVDDEGVGDDGVRRGGVGLHGGLSHAITEGFAAAEFQFVAVMRVVLFDFDEQIGVAKPHAVACGRSEHARVVASGDGFHVTRPFRRLRYRGSRVPSRGRMRLRARPDRRVCLRSMR